MLASFLHQGKKATNVFCVNHPFQAIWGRKNVHFFFNFFLKFRIIRNVKKSQKNLISSFTPRIFARIRIRNKMRIRNTEKYIINYIQDVSKLFLLAVNWSIYHTGCSIFPALLADRYTRWSGKDTGRCSRPTMQKQYKNNL